MTGLFGVLLLAVAKKTTSSGSSFFIVIILIAVAGYFLLLRPQQKKARRQRTQQQSVAVGDEIVTVGGIRGQVVAIDDQHVTIVTGNDVTGFAAAGSQPHRITLVRNAVARKVDPPMAEPDDYDGHDDVDSSDGSDTDTTDHVPGDGKAEGGGTGS